MHGPSLRTALLGTALLVLVLAPGVLRAHKLDEVLVELTLGEESWKAEARLDSRYVVATLMRHHLPPTPDLAWIHSRSPGEYVLMRDVTETFYREKFQFVMNGKIAEVTLVFPDYATDPPRFTADEEGTPSLRVELTGRYPAGSGPMILKWNSDWGPTLVLLLKRAGQESQPAAVLVGLGGEAELGIRGEPGVSEGGEGTISDGRSGGGIAKILPGGVLPLLFLAGLFLLAPGCKPVRSQVLCFALAQFGALAAIVLIPVQVAAGVIALLAAGSVAYLGAENLFLKKVTSWRLGIVSGFGLVHGTALGSVLLGDAAGWQEESGALAKAVAGVVGVQALVIAAAALAVWLAVRAGTYERLRVLASALLACAGVCLIVTQWTG